MRINVNYLIKNIERERTIKLRDISRYCMDHYTVTISIKFRFYLHARWVCIVPILSSDMLEGLLHHTIMVQRVVVQWGTEQGVVVLQEDEGLIGVAECTRQGVVLQEDEGLGVAECTRQGVVVQEDRGLGVAEGRTWDRGLGVAEGRT